MNAQFVSEEVYHLTQEPFRAHYDEHEVIADVQV